MVKLIRTTAQRLEMVASARDMSIGAVVDELVLPSLDRLERRHVLSRYHFGEEPARTPPK
jgi:hypothetical protein